MFEQQTATEDAASITDLRKLRIIATQAARSRAQVDI
jgi:hypothetical protein